VTDILQVEGIGKHQASKLAGLGITTQAELLVAAATPPGRQQLVAKTGCTMEQILTWANRADLARIDGLDGECADLLEAAGVDTVPELAQRNAAHLHVRLLEVNDERLIAPETPTPEVVARWVLEAKSLPRALHY
jgi:predicted flap endonuclease-1-like 5' DNA nuclease